MINFNIKKSFTLVEVLVSASILAVGLVSVIGTFSVGMKYSSNAKQSAQAVGIMQEAMESAIALGYDVAVGAGDKVRFSENPENPFYSYQTKTDAAFVDGNLNEIETDSGLKKITVSVFWNVSGVEKKDEAVTLIARQ